MNRPDGVGAPRLQRPRSTRTAAVVGLGSAGRRHVGVIRRCLPGWRVVGVRHNAEHGPSEAVDDNVYSSSDAVALEPEFAVIAGPSSARLDATVFIDAGIPLLIEKPLAATADHADALHALIDQRQVYAEVGYNLRFHSGVRELNACVKDGVLGRVLHLSATVGQHLAQWRPGIDHRRTVSAQPALGGGALLELSHEIDLAMLLCGDVSAVTAQTASIGEPPLQVEDVADVLLRFASGGVGHVHVDLVNRVPRRECVVVGTRGTAQLDLISGRLCVETPEKAWTHFYPQPELMNTYDRQFRAFYSAVHQRKTTSSTLSASAKIVRVIDVATRSNGSASPMMSSSRHEPVTTEVLT